MENIGNILRKKRLEQEISLEKISEKTKIKIKVLEALEKGESSDLFNEGYERIMLISFARAIGFCEEEINKLFNIKKDSVRIPNDNYSKELFPSRVMFNKNILLCVLLIITTVVIVITVYNLYKNQQIDFPFRNLGDSKSTTPGIERESLLPDNDDYEREVLPLPNNRSHDSSSKSTTDNQDNMLSIITIESISHEEKQFDKPNYLKTLLSINTDHLFPINNEDSYIRMFVIND